MLPTLHGFKKKVALAFLKVALSLTINVFFVFFFNYNRMDLILQWCFASSLL